MNEYEKLNIIANIFQILDLNLNLSQASNDSLMKKLLAQDKVLDDQTNIYLKKCLQNQEIIIKLLQEMGH